MAEAAETPGTKPPVCKKKRTCLSLKSKRQIVAVDERRVGEAKKPIIPKNTEKATAWAFRLFNQWLVEHNNIAETKCPPDILLTKILMSSLTGCVYLFLRLERLTEESILHRV